MRRPDQSARTAQADLDDTLRRIHTVGFLVERLIALVRTLSYLEGGSPTSSVVTIFKQRYQLSTLFSHKDAFCDAFAADAVWKQKEVIHHYELFVIFPQGFQLPWMMKLIVIFRNFCIDVFKVDSCTSVVCRNGLIQSKTNENIPYMILLSNYVHVYMKQSLTLSNIHQICSRRLWKHLLKIWEISRYEALLTKIIENIVAKGVIARFGQFLLLS